jgi:molybdenum cofactor biosynthesis enzyme
MVSISSKKVTNRTATAQCSVNFSNPLAVTLIRENRVKKGDALGVARVAGIMAAKRTADLIPLCHPVAITHVEVEVDLRYKHKVPTAAPVEESAQAEAGQDSLPWAGTGYGDAYNWPSSTMPTRVGAKAQSAVDENRSYWVHISATVSCEGKTGVEMEALTAASVAALTVYDMCKSVDKGIRIGGLRVVRKEGGKSGTWVEGVSVG